MEKQVTQISSCFLLIGALADKKNCQEKEFGVDLHNFVKLFSIFVELSNKFCSKIAQNIIFTKSTH